MLLRILLLLSAVLLLAWLVRRTLRRMLAAPAGALIELRLTGKLQESPHRPLMRWARWIDRSRASSISISDVHRLIDLVLADARVQGLLVVWLDVEAGWATLEALREALVRVQKGGKRLVGYLPEGGDDHALFALAQARPLIAAPSTSLTLRGPKSEAFYLRRTLERAGIDVELHARKEFKSAGDRFASEHRSDSDREQITAILDAVDAAVIRTLVDDRAMPRDAVLRALDGGPIRAPMAKQARLVDELAHDDDLPQLLGAPTMLAGKYVRRRRFAVERGARIGIVQVHGAIASGRSAFSRGMEPLAGSERVVADLRAAASSDDIAAVVLDVESPGGTILGSDAILAAARAVAKKKPLVVRFGDVAASGGYWVAMAGASIVARPLTITGSIGVVGLRPIAERLLSRLGVVRDVITKHPLADLDTLARAPTEEERAIVAREIDAHYEAFVQLVSEGRKKSFEETEALARGRVWIGQAALERGLVDELGGLRRACELAAKLWRAQDAGRANKKLAPTPIVVAARSSMPRPKIDTQAERAIADAVSTLIPRPIASMLRGAGPYLVAWDEGARVALLSTIFDLR